MFKLTHLHLLISLWSPLFGLSALAQSSSGLDRARVYDELIALQSEPGRQEELIVTLKKVLSEVQSRKLKLSGSKESEYRELLAQLLYDKQRPMEALQIIRATPIRVRTASSRLLERSIVEDLRGRSEVTNEQWSEAGLPAEFVVPEPIGSREWVASASLAQSESIGSGGGGIRYAHPVARGWRVLGDLDGFRYQTDRLLVENRLRAMLGLEWATPSELIVTAEGGYLFNTPGVPAQARASVRGAWLGAQHAALEVSLADDNASSPQSLLSGVSESDLRLYWERQLLPTTHLSFQGNLKLAHWSGQFGLGRGMDMNMRLGFSEAVDPAKPSKNTWAIGPWGQATAWRTESDALNRLLSDDTQALGLFGRFGRTTGGSLLSPSFNVAVGLGRDFLKEKEGINSGFVEGVLAGKFSNELSYAVEVGAYFEEISSFRTGGGTKVGRFDLIWTLP